MTVNVVGFSFSMARGYIRLHRSMTEWEWYQNERIKAVFLHLLLKCNWTEKKWEGQVIPAGSLVTSTVHLAEDLNMSRSAIVRALEQLEKSGEIVRKADNKRTAITLVKWADYQQEDGQAGQQTDNKRTTNGQQTDTTNKEKKERKEKDSVGRKRPRTQLWTVEDFKRECRSAIDADPLRLPQSEHKPFFDYWTESDGNDKLRFQAEKFFDVARRMATWKRNDFGGKPTPPAISPTAKPWMQ